jgi:sodium-dependent phosphate cotransporter
MTNPADADIATPSTRLVHSSTLNSLVLARWRTRLGKVLLFITSLFLFILAIMLMKDGSRGLAPLVSDLFNINNAANSLGFGWLFAYIIMSGSPVAAAALTFFDAGAIDKLGAFAMIIGSRLGASFIVLFIGFIYVLRGRDRSTSLSMGLLSLLVTTSTYLVSLLIGATILQTGMLDQTQLQTGMLLGSIIDAIFTPCVQFITLWLPGWALFPVGLAIIILSFNLFDRCLPQMTVKESQVGHMSRLVYRPWVMFLLGALITLMSMSVSVSLSILVPLSARGFIRRENVIPYIMGANITTFIDTLLAAVLLTTPAAFTIILTGMVSITLVSGIILLTMYHQYERLMLNTANWIISRNRNLAIFMGAIFLFPLFLLIL